MVIKKYDANLLGYMNLFKELTKVNLRDCFVLEDVIIFVTVPGKAGLAIGKGGKNIQIIKNKLKKPFKILEFADAPEQLAKNFVFPAKPVSVSVEDKKLSIKFATGRERRILLSDNQKKLKQLKAIIKRYYPDIEDILIPQ